VDVEIGTAANTRTERIVIEPKEEQSFSFKVDSPPLLVNFDQGGAIFKALEFQKPIDELLYQLAHDQDLAGRFWAFFELSERVKGPATNETDKRNIIAAFGDVLTKDSFWSLRTEAAKALAGVPDDVTRQKLIAATKDRDARVRAAATNTLRGSKDPTLADLYQQLLSDQSYLTVRTAALALGETHNPKAFDALLKLVESDSWRNTLRISALNGLGLLGDKRALDVAMRFASENQPMAVRIAALALTASVGKHEARARSLLFNELSKSVTVNNTVLINAVAEALVNLGDPEGLKALSAAREKSGNPQVKTLLSKSEERLRQSVRSAEEKPPGR
jgi:aminopeptidase N